MQIPSQNETNRAGEQGNASTSLTPRGKLAGGLLWTRRQRLTLAVLLMPMAMWLMYVAVHDRAQVADPQIEEGPRAGELATRVNPNSADWATLAALPVLGEKMAKEIVAYRAAHEAEKTGAPAFAEINDLMRVPGIGKATTRELEPLLVFPQQPELLREPR